MDNVISTYGAYTKNTNIRMESSSGGIFYEIANYILQSGGVVYGVAMSEDNKKAVYKKVNSSKELPKLFGSKYTQAVLGNAFVNVREDLEKGLLVCFSGTGCQINGLKSYLCCDYENLICTDVVCHGVPSPALWKKFVEFQEYRYGKLISVNFRCKDDRWRDFGMKENHLYISKDDDPYMQMFLKNYCLRPSCYECHAKTIKKSDITIADFWGVENIAPQIDDGKGTSLIIVRTEKGKQVFNELINHLTLHEVRYEDSVRYNPCEYESVKKPVQRDMFFTDMARLSFDELAKKYVEPSVISKIKIKLKKIVRMCVCGWGTTVIESNSDYGLLFTFEEK